MNLLDENMEKVDAIVSYSFSFPVTVLVPEGLDDNLELFNYYKQQYPTLEEMFVYLSNYFKVSTEKVPIEIKRISKYSIIDDQCIDFN